MFEGLGYRYSTNAKGLVRAFDVKTGKQLWRFNTIPMPGRVRQRRRGRTDRGSGPATSACGRRSRSIPKPGSSICRWKRRRSTNYGGNRPGNNLFAEASSPVDLKTGVRKWHFQHGASRPLGSRQLVGVAADRRDDQRRSRASSSAQPTQTGLALRVRPHHRSSRSGRSRSSRFRSRTSRTRRRPRRSRFRPSRRRYSRTFITHGRSDRLHATAARGRRSRT